jgi:hypothetical protein
MLAILEALPGIKQHIFVSGTELESSLPEVFVWFQMQCIDGEAGFIEAVELWQRTELEGV